MEVLLGVAAVDMVVVIGMGTMMAMNEAMMIMKVMVEDMAREMITATEAAMVTTTMMIIMVVAAVADMVMIVTVKAQGVVQGVGVVDPAEGGVVVIQGEVVIEVDEEAPVVVALRVEEVALQAVVDPEVVVLPQLKGSMVQTHTRHPWSTPSQNAGSWARTNQAAVGEASQSLSNHCTIVVAMATKDQTRSGTVTIIGSSGSRPEEKFWLAAVFDLATLATLSLFIWF